MALAVVCGDIAVCAFGNGLGLSSSSFVGITITTPTSILSGFSIDLFFEYSLETVVLYFFDIEVSVCPSRTVCFFTLGITGFGLTMTSGTTGGGIGSGFRICIIVLSAGCIA